MRDRASEDDGPLRDAAASEPDGSEDDPPDDDAVERRALVVSAAQGGERLDKVLAAGVPEFSRSHLQQLIESGCVLRAGRPVAKAATRVARGDRLEIELRPTQQSQAFLPEPMALDIVHQDAHLLVVRKPAGLVTHPAPGNWSGTLLNGLLAHDAQAARLPRAGIVHRLDKDTSGLMVVARSRAAMDALVRAIAAREVSRQYLALAHRPWIGAPRRELDMPIGRDPRNRLRMAVVDLLQHAGKTARTTVDLLAEGDAGCLVRCTLHTGRTHQIRVHMARIGHPLVGDALYGGAPAAGMRRQALHAFRLAFVHPASGESMRFEAPPPQDFQDALRAWALDYNPA
ncbi:MAG: RluA family pseudouridine synthase [Xylophilus ampelinus]